MNSSEITENHFFNLINGKFDPKEALPLIFLLYNAKIEHHNRKSLRLKEINDISFKDEDERVFQLEKEYKDFKDLMKSTTLLGYDVIIKSDIQIQVIKKQQ